MKMVSGALFLFALSGLVVALLEEDKATPVTKVLELLNNMAAKGKAELNAEESKYAAFSQWCSDETSGRKNEIKTAEDNLELLNANIQQADVRIKELADRVLELEEDVGRWSQDTKSVSDIRDKEKTDYVLTAQDYSESIDAIERAVQVLQRQAGDRSQTEAALLQVKSLALVPGPSKAALSAFLQQVQMPSEELEYQAPEANAYEFQSGGVVDILAKLKTQFMTKKHELDVEEMSALHAFEQTVQSLTDNIENAKHEISRKSMAKEETAQSKADTQGTVVQVTADRVEDVDYLTDMTALCSVKSTDFENRQKLRKDELEALAKAIVLISGDDVTGAAERHLSTALLQTTHRAVRSLAQLRHAAQSPVQVRLAEFLRQRAASCHSELLSLVSQRVSSDPFSKVKKMIKGLISKLMQESTSETEHKGWCDAELTTNKMTRDAKTAETAKLSSDVEDLSAEITQIGQDLTDLAAQLKDISSSMAKASADRMDSKTKNEQTVQEAKLAQTALTQAMSILKEYYAKSAQSTSLSQQTPEIDAPETWNSAYTGQLPASGSVIDFLEVILADFARLQGDAESAESTEQSVYEKFMFEAEKNKALKENESKHKSDRRSDKEISLHSTRNELKLVQEQLDNAVVYYNKLKPNCVDSGISYEERVKRREVEIQSLQEALQILTGTDFASDSFGDSS